MGYNTVRLATSGVNTTKPWIASNTAELNEVGIMNVSSSNSCQCLSMSVRTPPKQSRRFVCYVSMCTLRFGGGREPTWMHGVHVNMVASVVVQAVRQLLCKMYVCKFAESVRSISVKIACVG